MQIYVKIEFRGNKKDLHGKRSNKEKGQNREQDQIEKTQVKEKT